VTSNPSRDYIQRVAIAFGEIGDMQSVIKAILLDPEARTPSVVNSTTFGKFKEPLLQLTAVMRLLKANSRLALNVGDEDADIIGTNYQASRWLTLPGINVSFQTSDFAKLALIMYLSRVLSKKQGQITNFKSVFLTIMLPILIVCGLILPANFSTSAMLFIICIIIMFIGKVNIKYILYLVTISAASFFLYVTILSNLSEGKQDRLPTWESRWQSFKNKSNEPGGQVEQAKIAIATGGLFGKSPGKSTQRNFLPYAYSDFIFAIIIEEYGLIGGIVLILMYLILLFRGIKIATKTPRYFGTFLTMGCCFSLVFQAFINVAVAVNILPVTGQTLPFVSMGGTSILFMSITVGIMLSVSKETEKKLKPAIINEISKSKDN
jgi:cell division protein FtsW